MIILRNLAEQQKNQREIKTKNRILKQNHDIKVAESLSPITKNKKIFNQSTKKLREIIKESNSENETPQSAIENTQNDIQPGVTYDKSLSNTLSNMKNKREFLDRRKT